MLFPSRPAVAMLLRIHPRLLHASPLLSNLVAPPDPVSHMRPIIYEDLPVSPDASKTSAPTLLRHPYSLSEFSNATGKDLASSLELQFRFQRQQLDAFHHTFWYDGNSRFEAAKEAILSALPSTATALDKEKTLSEFYRQWVMQEKARTDAYTTEWRRRNIALIILEARISVQKLSSYIGGFFTTHPGR